MCRTSTELALAFLIGNPVAARFNFATMLTLFNYMMRGHAGDVLNPDFATEVCKKHILDHNPDLRNVDVGEFQSMLELGWSDRDARNLWLAEQVLRFGTVVDIPPLPEATIAFLTRKPSHFTGETSRISVLSQQA